MTFCVWLCETFFGAPPFATVVCGFGCDFAAIGIDPSFYLHVGITLVGKAVNYLLPVLFGHGSVVVGCVCVCECVSE